MAIALTTKKRKISSRSSAGALTDDTRLKLTIVNVNQVKCWPLRRGENRSTGRKTSRCRVENQQTQPTWCRVWELNPDQVCGKQVLSPLRHPCTPIITFISIITVSTVAIAILLLIIIIIIITTSTITIMIIIKTSNFIIIIIIKILTCTYTLPEIFSVSPRNADNNVLFPHPTEPTTATSEPLGILTLMLQHIIKRAESNYYLGY